jgi:putative FmdB family regulatory protein
LSFAAGHSLVAHKGGFWRFFIDELSWDFVVPIYAYKCSACGHEQDVLQKMSDPRLTVCPECGQSTYTKQVTAAGFQLKGSGWYVTDFRDNGTKPAQGKAPSKEGAPPAAAAPGGAASGDSPAAKSESAKTAAPSSAPASPPSSTSGPTSSSTH